MAETFILWPTMTDDEILQGITSTTKYVVVIDHTNTETTGGPRAKQYLQGQPHLLDQLVKQYPNCVFFLDHYRTSLDGCDNVIWIPLTFIWPATMIKDPLDVPVDWGSRRRFTVNHLGGRNRINRILLEHWLAKNYPLDQLTYTKPEESDLSMIKPVIDYSSYATRSHVSPRKNLPVRWNDLIRKPITNKPRSWRIVASDGGDCNYIERDSVERRLQEDDVIISQPEEFPYRRFDTGINLLIPQYKLTSYLSLQTEPQDITLNTDVGEKTWESFAGGTLVLQFGNYRVFDLYHQLGLETFANCFYTDHLDSLDRYYQTIGGCELNKQLIIDHEAIENLWHENLSAIQHNHHLALDINHWLELFKPQLKILSEALTLATNRPTIFWTYHVVDRFRHEFKL